MPTRTIPSPPAIARQTRAGDRREEGFTLVEALVAIIVLVFGLMAVTNLMIVAASSNSVANQGTAAVTSATRIMELIKASSYQELQAASPGGPASGLDFSDPLDLGPACADAVIGDYHCTDDIPGVGRIHTHWVLTNTNDPRIIFVHIRSEGTGALSATRSRSEFTTFRACTNAEPATGSCPEAP
jgi:type II secretory pathway pseudopilin PulG